MSREVKDFSNFIKEYFENIDFNYWEKRLNFCIGKLNSLKTEKAKEPYNIDLYAIYLQILEIFFINVLILSYGEGRFLDHIFIGNKKLREKISTHLSDQRFIDWIFDNLIFGIKEKDQIPNYEKKRKDSLNILLEAGKDYLDHYEFLNAYKHGYRVQVGAASRLSINGYKLLETDTHLIYFSKERTDKKTQIVYKHRMLFNHKRISWKALTVLEMLKTCQAIFLTRYKKEPGTVLINHYYIDDSEEWSKSFGGASIKEELFILKRADGHE